MKKARSLSAKSHPFRGGVTLHYVEAERPICASKIPFVGKIDRSSERCTKSAFSSVIYIYREVNYLPYVIYDLRRVPFNWNPRDRIYIKSWL